MLAVAHATPPPPPHPAAAPCYRMPPRAENRYGVRLRLAARYAISPPPPPSRSASFGTQQRATFDKDKLPPLSLKTNVPVRSNCKQTTRSPQARLEDGRGWWPARAPTPSISLSTVRPVVITCLIPPKPVVSPDTACLSFCRCEKAACPLCSEYASQRV